jgi:hypothetical protein
MEFVGQGLGYGGKTVAVGVGQVEYAMDQAWEGEFGRAVYGFAVGKAIENVARMVS